MVPYFVDTSTNTKNVNYLSVVEGVRMKKLKDFLVPSLLLCVLVVIALDVVIRTPVMTLQANNVEITGKCSKSV